MSPYALKVFLQGEAKPIESVEAACAADLVDLIPVLLLRHAGCHRIRAYLHESLLFSVDCEGQGVRE